jgi:hypothetical protein
MVPTSMPTTDWSVSVGEPPRVRAATGRVSKIGVSSSTVTSSVLPHEPRSMACTPSTPERPSTGEPAAWAAASGAAKGIMASVVAASSWYSTSGVPAAPRRRMVLGA